MPKAKRAEPCPTTQCVMETAPVEISGRVTRQRSWGESSLKLALPTAAETAAAKLASEAMALRRDRTSRAKAKAKAERAKAKAEAEAKAAAERAAAEKAAALVAAEEKKAAEKRAKAEAGARTRMAGHWKCHWADVFEVFVIQNDDERLAVTVYPASPLVSVEVTLAEQRGEAMEVTSGIDDPVLRFRRDVHYRCGYTEYTIDWGSTPVRMTLADVCEDGTVYNTEWGWVTPATEQFHGYAVSLMQRIR